jgi:hypothetical protein
MTGTAPGGVQQAHSGGNAQFPMAVLNGYLTRSRNRSAPSTDIDHTPREFRRYVDASGAQSVQINNGLRRRIGQGTFAPLIYAINLQRASTPVIPGQRRDDYSGKHKKGMDPLSYQSVWNAGPGSQPMHPGGVRQIAGELQNPGTS